MLKSEIASSLTLLAMTERTVMVMSLRAERSNLALGIDFRRTRDNDKFRLVPTDGLQNVCISSMFHLRLDTIEA